MAKSTKDFTIKIGDDKPKPRVPLRRAAATDDETINKAVEQVAKQAAGQGSAKAAKPAQEATKAKSTTSKSTAKAKPAKAAARRASKPATEAPPLPDPELVRKLSNKRLTIDIPLYLHEALRQYNHINRTTAKDLINDYLHQLTKTDDIRPKK